MEKPIIIFIGAVVIALMVLGLLYQQQVGTNGSLPETEAEPPANSDDELATRQQLTYDYIGELETSLAKEKAYSTTLLAANNQLTQQNIKLQNDGYQMADYNIRLQAENKTLRAENERLSQVANMCQSAQAQPASVP